jgi:DNA-directed RNA polymerase specialized sigma24 family protein
MDSERPIEQIEELLAVRGGHLRRTATLLAGGPEDGEDLLQAALERMFRRRRAAIADPRGLPAAHHGQSGRRRLAAKTVLAS